MKTFKVLSLLLCYPEPEWPAALPEMHTALEDETDFNGGAPTRLAPLFDLLHESKLIALQENYVATFDRNPSHSLHLFEHIHGESRDRGSAMIDLLEEYWKHDFDASAAELPDYVPLFLEFLSLLPAEEALELLGDAVRACHHRPQARRQRQSLCHCFPGAGSAVAGGGTGTGRAASARHGRGDGTVRPVDGWCRTATQARSTGNGGADAGVASAGGRFDALIRRI